jgi:hypothetical protein
MLRWDSQEVQNLATLYGVIVSPASRYADKEIRCYIGHTWFWVGPEWPLSHWIEAIGHHGFVT